MRKPAALGIFVAFLALCPALLPQISGQSDESQSLGDAARKQRALKDQQARSAGNSSTSSPQANDSLGDVARKQREKSFQEVRTSLQDSQKLFASIEETLQFASQHSGYAKHTAVKYQLIGEDEVIRQMTQNMSSSEDAQRLARSELVLKKFGLLPNNFDLKTFLLTAAPKSYLAYYDPRTKMINLLNFVEFSEQLPILSHELTHALQDQNYDLMKWRGYTRARQAQPAKMRVDSEDEQEGAARVAVVEGQAEIVHFDYLLKAFDRTLADTPQVMDFLQYAATQTYNDVVVVHNAPLLLKETGIFPYREGLNFELELLRTGGKQMAFAGAFARPPRNTHEVLEPDAYISAQKPPAALIPDLTALLAGRYEAYDSGIIGQLDVRVMARQFGREDDAFSLPPNWNGGAYVAVKRAGAGGEAPTQPVAEKAATASTDRPAQFVAADKGAPASTDKPTAGANEKPASVSTDKPASTAASPVATPTDKPAQSTTTPKPAQISTRDVALLYVSRWKTLESAQRFLQIYQNSLPKRVAVLDTKNSPPANCAGNSSPTCGPLWGVRVITDEGPVFLEIWPNNLVFISQSFDEPTAVRLRQAVLLYTPTAKATTSTAELSLHLSELPEFRGFQEEIGREIYSAVVQFSTSLQHR
jgi:hypothetical protein